MHTMEWMYTSFVLGGLSILVLLVPAPCIYTRRNFFVSLYLSTHSPSLFLSPWIEDASIIDFINLTGNRIILRGDVEKKMQYRIYKNRPFFEGVSILKGYFTCHNFILNIITPDDQQYQIEVLAFVKLYNHTFFCFSKFSYTSSSLTSYKPKVLENVQHLKLIQVPPPSLYSPKLKFNEKD